MNKISIALSNILENNFTVILFFLFSENFGNQYKTGSSDTIPALAFK